MAAKTANQSSVKQVKAEFLRYLSMGESVDMAASKAGINDGRTIQKYICEFYGREETQASSEIEARLEAEAIHTAVSTLKEICTRSEEDKDRNFAAKVLLDFAKSGRKGKNDKSEQTSGTTIQVEGTNLWQFKKS